MAIVSAHRDRMNRAAKDRLAHSLHSEDHPFVEKMSFPAPPQSHPPGAMTHLPVNPPSTGNKSAVPQNGVDRGALRKRKTSKARPNDLRRSASTPHLGKAHPETEPMSPMSDKKRNKLGYHRSSIACSHCRRRKIRCLLPSPDDTQGRCTNCIRLKKECNFYPVDQGPPIDIKPTAQTRGDITMSSAPSASSHSSPHMSGASQPSSVAESAAHLHYHSPEAGTKRQKRDMGAFAVPASAQGATQNEAFSYAHRSDGQWGSQQPAPVQYTQPHRVPIEEPQYWSATNTPTSAHYSQDSSHPFAETTPTAFHNPNFAYPPGSIAPFVPVRSMSYGHIEGLPQHPGQQSGPFTQQESHPAYTLPSQAQFSHNTYSHHGSVNVPQQNVTVGSVPRAWSSAPSAQAPQPTSHSYQQSPAPIYYEHQQPIQVYEARGQVGYNQYYAPGSQPG